jgi:hypothetical protein
MRASAAERTVQIWRPETSPDDRLSLDDAAALARATVAELRAAGARGELDIRGPRDERRVRRGDLIDWARRRRKDDDE